MPFELVNQPLLQSGESSGVICENDYLQHRVAELEKSQDVLLDQNAKLQESLMAYELACGVAVEMLQRLSYWLPPHYLIMIDEIGSVIASLHGAQRLTSTLLVNGVEQAAKDATGP